MRHTDTSPFQQGSPLSEEYHPHKPHVYIYAGRLFLDTDIDLTGKFSVTAYLQTKDFRVCEVTLVKARINLCN